MTFLLVSSTDIYPELRQTLASEVYRVAATMDSDPTT